MKIHSRYIVIAFVILAGLSAALTTPGQPQLVRFWAGVALLWLLPGLSWSLAVQDAPLAERLAFGTGLAFVANGLATLLLCLLPGPFPTNAARLLHTLIAIAPTLRFWAPNFRHSSLPHLPRGQGKLFVVRRSSFIIPTIILLIAALARLPNLGYSEFQGDEAVIMRRAAQAVAGDDSQLFLHQKGPVEILLPMSLWALTGSTNELQARLPFALVGLLAVAAVALLGARWFDSRTGILAGLIVAINGFLVAFARIVQYQNTVVAMSALGLLALTAYARYGRLRDALLGTVLLAYGLLAHYDAVLVAPAALWLTSIGVATRRIAWPRELGQLTLAGIVGIATLAVFYVPFVTNPNFARTLDYLSSDRLGSGGPLYNNIGSVWVMSTFYNSTYYVAGLLALVGIWIAGFLPTTSRFAQQSAIHNTQHAARNTQHIPAAFLYFVVPFIFYLFLVFTPRTHVYTFYPGAALLGGAVLSSAWERIRVSHRGIAIVLVTISTTWYTLCAGYVGLVFVNHTPEYKREWPTSKSALYPTTFQELPLFGFFGFPYRAGWKAVEELYVQGVLTGTYASNEEPEITTWYVRSGARTLCNWPRPDLYIVAEHVQDEVWIDWDELQRVYHPVAQITVAGRSKIHIYRRRAVGSPIPTFKVENFAQAFDQGTSITAQLPRGYKGAHPTEADFGEIARLLGYDLSSTSVRQGSSLTITLYWQALSSPQRHYQVFTHLVAENNLIAQHDGTPGCALAPTTRWEPGQVIRDEHLILIGEDVPVGKVALNVGMYDLFSLERLPLANDPDNALSLGEIEILPK